MRLTFQCSW